MNFDGQSFCFYLTCFPASNNYFYVGHIHDCKLLMWYFYHFFYVGQELYLYFVLKMGVLASFNYQAINMWFYCNSTTIQFFFGSPFIHHNFFLEFYNVSFYPDYTQKLHLYPSFITRLSPNEMDSVIPNLPPALLSVLILTLSTHDFLLQWLIFTQFSFCMMNY